ncbi:ketopantoate hydroxymethyltransferase [Cohnella sp.]|uniref:ketopantoate hydroxymethyltransferase n=1 Tax=Cohnella sp. TaxID=1883426 RepID=UPI0035686393
MINTQFLHDVAGYVDSRIAKVVLNGSYVITDFTARAVEDGMVALNYIVPVADVSLITLIELRDSDNVLITSDVVNVPLTSDTKMLQTVEAKEVVA